MSIVSTISGLYDGTVDFLTHPVRKDMPVWQIIVGSILLSIVAFWIIDNSNMIVRATKQSLEAL